MRLRQQIITASVTAGIVFTFMLCWMAYFTYQPEKLPNWPTFTAFLSVVLLFWWLIGSIVANVVVRDVERSVSAIRGKIETGVGLRRRLDKQRQLLKQFSSETLPVVMGLADHAAQVAKQSSKLAGSVAQGDTLEQLATLADECSEGLARLAQHAHQGNAQAQLLQHDLANLEAQESPLSAQLAQLSKLASQCNVLALNAAIENARTMDRTRGVGLLTEEIKELSTAAEALAQSVQTQAYVLRESAQQSIRSAVPLHEQVKAVADEAESTRALHDEQCEAMDRLRGAAEVQTGDNSKSLRAQMQASAEALKSASQSLRHALETTLKELQVA